MGREVRGSQMPVGLGARQDVYCPVKCLMPAEPENFLLGSPFHIPACRYWALKASNG